MQLAVCALTTVNTVSIVMELNFASCPQIIALKYSDIREVMVVNCGTMVMTVIMAMAVSRVTIIMSVS